MRRYAFFVASCFIISAASAQEVVPEDSVKGNLGEVIVRAFEQNRRLAEVAASVNVISRSDLERYNNTSVLPALNATAGVRMEERSPGSYRLNIRGSSLRSPFGVRNVKIYYNNIPFTDPGGQTYFNQLGYYNFQSIEVIKGPGSSLYGSGTGGVMLVQSNTLNQRNGVFIDQTFGSFGMSQSHIGLITGNENIKSSIHYQHQESAGYRNHSELRRDVLTYDVAAKINENDRFNATFLYGDLSYETPGALTLAEYNTDPKMARPRVGFAPGSEEMKAAILQKTFLAGFNYDKYISANWRNRTTVYGALSRLHNPTIRNYGRTNEPHFGGRTVFEFKKEWGDQNMQWHTGAEVQQGFTNARIYGNKAGVPDSLQTDDDLNSMNAFVFTQLNYQLKNWIFTGGLSFNKAKIDFIRLASRPATTTQFNFSNELAPRLAVLRELTNNISTYVAWSKGFSPPTTAELFPTGSISNPDLSAEEGHNYELGFKGNALANRLWFDVNAFYFRLRNTIVQRRDALGGDYFENAGQTSQKGLEVQTNYALVSGGNTFSAANISASYTHYNFRYKSFKQLANDFSGNQLPSVPKDAFTIAFDAVLKLGIYTNLTYFYNSKIALNDANSEYANAYNLLSARLGYKKQLSKIIGINIFAGGENLLDETYSLGNDINGFGGRYYNPAAGRNYFGGVSLSINPFDKQ
ncbi:MAG: TonB-dependent receptor [Segetibacter sp.]|nr:TonB-dependent receptor [Segetibacter sp.]